MLKGKTVALVDAFYHGGTVSCVDINHRQARIVVARKMILENKAKKLLYIAGKRIPIREQRGLQGSRSW